MNWPADALAQRSCPNDWQAELVAAEGIVELGTPTGWIPIDSGTTLCHGDVVRTGPFSRALVWLPDGNGTALRFEQDATFRVLALEDQQGNGWYDVVIKVLQGMLHVISRDPRSLAFDTPFVNAGIEGTELVIDTGPEGTTVDVIEGAVAMSNAAGATSVTGGTSGFAAPNRGVEASSKDVLGSLASAHRFPPIIAGELPLPNAVPTDSEAASADFHVRRAARRLDVGAIPEAEQDLATALALEPGHGDALALQALIALAQKRRDDAAALVDEALRTAPESAAPWLARSYVLPDSDPQALESAETAARVEPGNAFAWARIGELRLVNDNYRGGRAAAQQAAQLDPSLAHAHTVLGFAELTGGTTRAAEAAFRQAVRVDPADPLARLGLGLALYRQRDTDAARKETEIAVALDPARSTLRGYVGKIYDEEGRSVGGTVLAIAKALNEEDPTGYYYDALRKQHDNRLGEAFLDFSRSFEQTGRRSVHGAQLALDEDLLARSAGVGRLHSALGFDRRGLLAAWRAMMNDPTEYSAHRVAADLYAYRPGRQLARVNEVHQAILRQPLNVTPIQAQLGEVRPYVHDQAGMSPLTFREFNPLMRENGLSYQLSGVTGSHGTTELDFSVNGLHDRASYNLSIFDFHTDGFRANNDFDERVVSALVQLRPNASTTLTTELRSSDIDKGDLALRFDPDAYFPLFRESESLESVMLGISHKTGRGAWLATAIADRADAQFSGVGIFGQAGTRRGASFDVQYVTNVGRWNVTAGARHLDQQQTDELDSYLPFHYGPPYGDESLLPIPASVSDAMGRRHDVVHSSLYAYGTVELSESLWATLGTNVEQFESRNETHGAFSPKIGLMWDISERTTLRAAAISGLQAPFVSRRNAQRTLEPTHVVGFNQQYFGSEGEEAWRFGVALDHEFAENLYGGIELSVRDVDTSLFRVSSDTSLPVRFDINRDELSHLAYLYWLPTPSLSLAATYQYDKIDGGETTLPEGFSSIRTHRFPIEVTYSHPSGLSVGIEAHFVDQAGHFSPVSDDAVNPVYGEDRFWTVDLAFAYRLPARRGLISWRILNATDKNFRFQDLDPENPRLFPDRMMQLGFTLSY